MRTFARLARTAWLASFAITASVVSTMANSETESARIYFGTGALLSGSFQPGHTFAQLSVTPAGFNVFNFTLTSNDLDRLFTNGAFIGAISVNTSPNITASNVLISNFSGSGVDRIFAIPRGGPNDGFDFKFKIGTGGGGGSDLGGHRLGANEVASWTATFNVPTAVHFGSPTFGMSVQGLTKSQGGGAWYAASPAPEPEIYAMMLVGSLLVGFAARRRRQARFA